MARESRVQKKIQNLKILAVYILVWLFAKKVCDACSFGFSTNGGWRKGKMCENNEVKHANSDAN